MLHIYTFWIWPSINSIISFIENLKTNKLMKLDNNISRFLKPKLVDNNFPFVLSLRVLWNISRDREKKSVFIMYLIDVCLHH